MHRWLFRVRTLLLLIPILGVLFVVSLRWPVREAVPPFYPLLGVASFPTVRSPTPREAAARTGVSAAVLLAGVAALGVAGGRAWGRSNP